MRQLDENTPGQNVLIKTSLGDLKLKLFEEVAPKAVENFIRHAKDSYYDGLIFHRIIEDFMIQGGDPTGTSRGGESIYGHPFEDEINLEYRHIYGALSMANSGPNTNGSQFFIVHGPKEIEAKIIEDMRKLGAESGYPDHIVDGYQNNGGAYWLDGKHTVFGQVVEGLDVLEEIASVPTDSMDKPLEDVTIQTIEIL